MTTNNNHGGGGGPHNQQPTAISNGFTPIQNAVLTLLKTVTTLTGYSATDICKQLKQFSEHQVK